MVAFVVCFLVSRDRKGVFGSFVPPRIGHLSNGGGSVPSAFAVAIIVVGGDFCVVVVLSSFGNET